MNPSITLPVKILESDSQISSPITARTRLLSDSLLPSLIDLEAMDIARVTKRPIVDTRLSYLKDLNPELGAVDPEIDRKITFQTFDYVYEAFSATTNRYYYFLSSVASLLEIDYPSISLIYPPPGAVTGLDYIIVDFDCDILDAEEIEVYINGEIATDIDGTGPYVVSGLVLPDLDEENPSINLKVEIAGGFTSESGHIFPDYTYFYEFTPPAQDEEEEDPLPEPDPDPGP